ncbi:MAG TPA: hypothetical protein VFE62_20085 [Gemmataceae bacterium]|nr:hypothetical protein [Gemmataceae bacterium]
MLYKTIVLELIQQRPAMYERLRRQRQLLNTMNRYSKELKASHLEWKEHLAQARPGSDPIQIESEAMEIALAKILDHLPSESPPNGEDPACLDAAIAFIHQPTPHA